MNSEVEKILKENINWMNNYKLRIHTIKHPIKEIENIENWKKALNLSFIAQEEKDPNYKKTEKEYKRKSREILSDKDAVGYFHNGINNDGTPYYSIGLFHKGNLEIPLITYIQRVDKYRNSKPYIATCFFRKIDFCSKLYYAYQILENTDSFFTYNLSKEDLLKKFNIDSNFNLKEIHKLVDSSVADDKIGNIYAYYFNNKTITTEHYVRLNFEFKNNVYFEEIEKINKKIEEYESIIKNLEENYIEEEYKDWLYQIKNKEIVKVLKKKYKDEKLLKKYLSKTVNIFIEKVKLRLLKNENYIKKCIITTRMVAGMNHCFLEKYGAGVFVRFLDDKNRQLCDCQVLNGFIVKIKEEIKKLEKQKNRIINELSMDDELLFELGLIKTIAFTHPDYINQKFDYPNEFKNKYDEILRKYI